MGAVEVKRAGGWIRQRAAHCNVLCFTIWSFPLPVIQVSSSLLNVLNLKQLISFQFADSEESMLRKMQRPTKDSKSQPDNEVSSREDLGR